MRNHYRRLAALTTLTALTVALSISPATAAGVNPNPSPELPSGLENKLNTGLGLLMGVAVFAAVLGVIIVAILMFVASRRGSLEDHFGRLGAVLIGCILLGSASSIVMFVI